jgi:hypothetical protein
MWASKQLSRYILGETDRYTPLRSFIEIIGISSIAARYAHLVITRHSDVILDVLLMRVTRYRFPKLSLFSVLVAGTNSRVERTWNEKELLTDRHTCRHTTLISRKWLVYARLSASSPHPPVKPTLKATNTPQAKSTNTPANKSIL